MGQPHPPLTLISPGQCITDHSRRKGYNSSQDLPNSVLDFVKLHPLMFEEVKPAGGEPLLVKKSVAYSQLAVDRVRALNGRSYDVLFMGTGEHGMSLPGLCWAGGTAHIPSRQPTFPPDTLLCSPGDGWIHKAVVVGSGIHIVEEVQVFRDPQPVESLVISHAQVRGGRSWGTCLCCKAAIGLFGGPGGHDYWVTPAQDTRQSPVGQPGERDQPGPHLLARCQLRPSAPDWSWGPFPVHPTKGELCCGAGEDLWAPWGTPQPSRTVPGQC